MNERRKNQKSDAEKYDERLKGTFISVVVIGVFILISWFGVFYYYITTV